MPTRRRPVQVHAALLRWLTGDSGADIRLTSHPFPALAHEQDMQINEEAGGHTWVVLTRQIVRGSQPVHACNVGKSELIVQRVDRQCTHHPACLPFFGPSTFVYGTAARPVSWCPSHSCAVGAIAARRNLLSLFLLSRRVCVCVCAGTLLLVMCVVLATSVLSASFAIFLVR